MTDIDNRIQNFLGSSVHIIVDRPIGYDHGDIRYEVNYGYLPGVFAGDGEEQDAYILGIDTPLETFDGRVIGIIRRKNDCEDKLVAAPEGVTFHQGEIAQAVAFQEQFFTSTIDSLFRKSCGVIPWRQLDGEKEYLILLQTNNCWSFPKGHMEAGETEVQTALRELREETGLTAVLDTKARTVSEYPIPPHTRKQVVLFPGEISGKVVPQKTEVAKYRWVKSSELEKYLHPDTLAAVQGIL